jgi:hypothetical protein
VERGGIAAKHKALLLQMVLFFSDRGPRLFFPSLVSPLQYPINNIKDKMNVNDETNTKSRPMMDGFYNP